MKRLLLFVFLYLCVLCASARRRVRINNPVTVKRGRLTFLKQRSDLQIEYEEGDVCELIVLRNNPTDQLIGALTTDRFDCNYPDDTIEYVHFGAISPQTDRVALQAVIHSSTETVIIPVTLQITVAFVQLEIVNNNRPLEVPRPGGTSGPIDSSKLTFSYNSETTDCRLTLLVQPGGLPRYGELVNAETNGFMQDCQLFLNAGVRYRHTRPPSPDRDNIPVLVELKDKSTNSVIKSEYFQVLVRIRNAQVNQSPTRALAALYVLEVNQFILTAITPDIIGIEDAETPAGELIFNITRPLEDGQGAIVSTDDRNLPLQAFRQQDVTDLKIAYSPPTDGSDVKRFFEVYFEAVDSEGETSDEFNLVIIVNPKNTLAPLTTKNKGLTLFEGQSRPFDRHVLVISDEDNVDDVVVTAINGPHHGTLYKEDEDGNIEETRTFTVHDLRRGVFKYKHDGSDTYSDNIVFSMNDGRHEVIFLIPVTISPLDDEHPRLTANVLLRLQEGQTVPITVLHLSATDVDSQVSSIRFVLEATGLPQAGQLIYRQRETPDPLTGFTFVDGYYEKPVVSFTQQDLADGRIFYRHDDSEVFEDEFRFRVQDDFTPPNRSPVLSFKIKIQKLDDLTPSLVPGKPLKMDVEEGRPKILLSDFLLYTDIDTEDDKLIYNITDGPKLVGDTGSAGFLVLTDNNNRVVTTFTQKRLKHGKITYRPPTGEQGTRQKTVEFTFSVADPDGNTLSGQKFIITLIPMDEVVPTVRSDIQPTVGEGKMIVLGREHLDAYDQDSNRSQIVFIVQSIPENGVIYRDGVPLRVGDRFTLIEVDNSRITYQHTGSETTSDQFQLVVSDGKNNQTATIRPKIMARDDTPPVLVHVRPISVNENGISAITQEIIKATDIDTNNLRLRFVVVQRPTKGEIRVNGTVADSFTQLDVLNGLVIYVHTGGEIGVSQDTDTFTLNITDDSTDVPGGNILGGIVLTITVLPVDNQPPVVTVTPGFKVFEGGRSQITFDNLTVSDLDTNIGDIICRVTSVPNEGYIENQAPVEGGEKSQRGKSINTFTIRNVLDGYIYYVQATDSGESQEPSLDRFTMVCGDTENNKAEPINFDIVVEPENDEPPKMFVEAFVVDEGGVLGITPTRLRATDGDVPKQTLTFVITKQPDHGEIVEQRLAGNVQITSFTMDDITRGAIFYLHDDTESKTDTFNVILTDGKYEEPKTITINILPVDDETPRLKYNRGLNLIKLGVHEIIRKRLLTATDIDSEDETLTYTLRVVPRMGYLQLLVGNVWRNLTVNNNFTQANITGNRVRFLSNGKDGGRDRFKFDLTDGSNTFVDREFIINIPQVDGTPPVLRIRPAVVRENNIVVISTDFLHSFDKNSQDQKIKYTVVQAAQYGRLENSDNPGIPVAMFTQLDLAGNKIRYVHTSTGEETMDTVEIRATDGVNDVLGTLVIMITATDDALPIVFNNQLSLDEGASKWITPFELRAEDADTASNKIVFTITQEPMHGKVRRKGKVGRQFTQEDLDLNLVTYEHDGSDTIEDEFKFTVSDSTNREFYPSITSKRPTHKSQVFIINVNPIDDMPPKIMRLLPIINLFPSITPGPGVKNTPNPISGDVGYCFSTSGLEADDPDSDVAQLRYVIVEQPEFGHITTEATGNASVTSFTQEEVNAGKACYILTNRNASSDIFVFNIIDSAGNTLFNQRIRLDWSYVEFASAFYEVKEDAGFLYITLKRHGDLNQESFVTIKAIGETAEKGVDFKPGRSPQVYFAVGVKENTWKLEIINDKQYERVESFRVELSEPVNTVLDEPTRTIVTIVDQDDEPTLSFGEAKYRVQEDVGELLIPIHRTGDSILETSVICSTFPNTATGTTPFTVESKSDYVTRPDSAHSSVIEFLEGDTEKMCRIIIIDDSLNEEDETFNVNLLTISGSKIGEISETEVTILTDHSDVPVFRFAQEEYYVDESDDYVTVEVLREGTDFSEPGSVQIATARSKPASAEPGLDYIPVSQMLEFAPGVIRTKVDIRIVDDSNNPAIEGVETFQARLLMAMNAIVGSPNRAIVYINDTVSDRPQFKFSEKTVTVNENDGVIEVVVIRTGDTSKEATVRCYTRQASAEVMMDFAERPNSDASIITFAPGERRKVCRVELMDDTLEETDESFRLHLSEPNSPDGAGIIRPHVVEIIVKDNGDKPIILFKETRLLVEEPASTDDSVYANLTIVRLGDISQLSIVQVYTEDTQAQSGTDYLPFSKQIRFVSNMSQAIVSIAVLGDGVAEGRESFKVRIGDDLQNRAEIRKDAAVAHIFIDDPKTGNGKTLEDTPVFPLPPVVVSLEDYDNAGEGRDPDEGYPVVCISSCNPKHPRYAEAGPICDVDDTRTKYEWKVADKGSDLVRLTSGTFFADVNAMVLDSVYLKSGGRVQCTAIPVKLGGPDSDTEIVGIPSEGDVVSISDGNGPCPRYDSSVIGAEPFSTDVSYVGPEDPNFPNMVKIIVRVPHYNGLVPVVSTQEPTNYDLLFTQSGFRTGSHPCSNLLMPNEYTTKMNFLTEDTGNENAQGKVLAYQYDTKMRSKPTLQFYRSLDLNKCMWTFESYYNMSEIVTKCGGTVAPDDTIRDNTQSHLDVQLPLHIGFAYYSPDSPDRWVTFRQDSSVKMSFVYDTQVLWEGGMTTTDQVVDYQNQQGQQVSLDVSQSSIHPQRIYIDENGRLRVTFYSKAGFRGQFILLHDGESSMVMSKNYPSRQFALELLSSPTTVVNAQQVWRLSSTLTLPDYTDSYLIKLIPCVVAQGVGYSNPLNCNPASKMTFELPLRFQQTSNPVDTQYRLDTQLYIVNKEATWLMESTADFGADIDQVFTPNAKVYGRIQVDPSQRIGSNFNLNLEKVYVCAGQEGYVPRYDPANGHYGCIRDRQELLYSKKIIDVREPDTTNADLDGVSFNGRSASQVPGAAAITSDANVDGFQFDVAPLYQTSANADNFVHALYRFSSNKRRRSTLLHVVEPARSKRDVNGQLEDQEGTGMQMIRLVPQNPDEKLTPNDGETQTPVNNPIPNQNLNREGVLPGEGGLDPGVDNAAVNTPSSGVSITPIIAAVAGVLVVIVLIIIIVVVVRRRGGRSEAKSAECPAPPPTHSATNAIPTKSGVPPDDDNTEV